MESDDCLFYIVRILCRTAFQDHKECSREPE